MVEDQQLSLDGLTPEDLRQFRLQKERDYYLSNEGFLDFVRDCGAAPDAEFQPHGKHCQDIIEWHGEPDPESEGKINYLWKLVLWPRGSFKSQVFNVGYCAWLIAGDPNLRILVCSETNRQAAKFVREVMKILETEWFRERFGVHKGAEWKPGAGSFVSAQRTRKGVKDPTLHASGVGEVQTGAHWDIVIMDDVCSQKNTMTPESIENLWHWFGETLAQLDPGCRLLVIGTLHHFADIYCRIMKTPEIRELFEISSHGWRDPIDGDVLTGPGELFFPNRLTREFVRKQKAIMPPRLFACFYENRPTTGEDKIFRPEYFRTIRDEDIPRNVWTYIFTDFAFIAEEKKKGKADRTCFWVVAVDCTRTAYVLDFYVGRWKPTDSVQLACDLWDRYQWANMKGIVVEQTTHSELLSSLFEEVRRRTFIRPKFISIAGRSQETKDIRIEAAEPIFREGMIYFAQSVREQRKKWDPLFAEMTEWPFSEHDDIPDAISDLNKRDKDNAYYCPAPPIGWRAQAAVRQFRPPTVSGRFNPDAEHTAHDRIQQAFKGDPLWTSSSQGNDRSGSDERTFRSQAIFRQPQKPQGW